MKGILYCLATAAVFLFGGWTAHAQDIEVNVLERTGDRIVVEMTAEWPSSLEALVDSTGIRQVAPAVQALTTGLLNVSHTVRVRRQALRSLQPPPVQILSADFTTLQLAAGMADASLRDRLAQSPAFVAGLGMERKRPSGTLAMALLRYDSAAGTLRRYDRLVVAVSDLPDREQSQRAYQTAVVNPHLSVERSVLADGLTFSFPINEEGIYRIGYDLLAEVLGGADRSIDDIDPRSLKIYGNGGEPLPAVNSAPRPAGLVENPVLVQGGGDGSFDEGDALIFYAKDVSGWRYDAGRWTHYKHDYSRANTYFIKVDGAPGKRVAGGDFPDFNNPVEHSVVTGRYFVEPDEFNWHRTAFGTGRTWWSTQLSAGEERAFMEEVTLPGLTGGQVSYQARVAVKANPRAAVFFEANGEPLGQIELRIVTPAGTSPAARDGKKTFLQDVQRGEPLTVKMRLENQSNDPKAALDWIRLLYPKRLVERDAVVRFATPGGESGPMEFILRGFEEEPLVWDVTGHGSISRLGARSADGTYRVQISPADTTTPREVIAFTEEALLELDADAFARVPHQNLHGISSYPDFVIVAPEPFREAAARLADRRRQEGLAVTIAPVDEIYNEFSGGVPDMRAVRDYFKFLYDRADRPGQMLRYALLFGDGHYNFRNLGAPEPTLTNWIFPYETKESLGYIDSYTSDDYFGLLDDQEGQWGWAGPSRVAPYGEPAERVDIGVGRLPVQTPEQARAAVDKIFSYEDPSTYGPWRLRYLFIADDGPTGTSGSDNDEDLHVQNAEVAADRLAAAGPIMNVEKIYGPTYERVYGVSWRLPQARQDILTALAEGVHVFNYSGHGGEVALAQERIFTKQDARSLDNGERLPVFVTVTCSFGRWDMAQDQSAGEWVVLNEGGGAIAAFTTVRVVYTSGNPNSLNPGLNRALIRYLFERDGQGRPLRLGDVMRLTKSTHVGMSGNSRMFNLLGDPTIRFGLPSLRARVSQVNGLALSDTTAQISALGRVMLQGEVITPDSTRAAGFNGQAFVTVFDASRKVMMPYQRYLNQPYFRVQEDLIWRGLVDVSQGVFEAEFIVPKDISYSNRRGRISIYAQAGEQTAGGFTERLFVGGTAENPPDDHTGPVISLFMNDSTFVSGGLVGDEPTLIVKLYDENGINVVGAGVGHQMLLTIDGEQDKAVDLSPYFVTAKNSYQRGEVNYDLSNYIDELDEGTHRLTVRAWDVLNNASTQELAFTVSAGDDLAIRNLYNYPNPTTGPTEFIFEHNQPPMTPAEVRIRLYTVSGQLIETLDVAETMPAGMLQSSMVRIPWNGLDADGDPLAPGVYLYHVRIAAEDADGSMQIAERIEKLAVIR